MCIYQVTTDVQDLTLKKANEYSLSMSEKVIQEPNLCIVFMIFHTIISILEYKNTFIF